jgi:hypothetical protein
LTLAAGGFAIGIVCAVAAHNVVTDFTRPSAVQEPVRETAVVQTPVYAAAAPAAASEPVEPVNRNRSRPSVAKMTLPSIGTLPATPSPTTDGRSSTDGRGGDGVSGGTSTANLVTPPSSDPPSATEGPNAAEQPAAAPAPKAERPAKQHVRRTVKKRREHPTNHGYAYRNQPFFGFGGPAYRGYGQVYARQQYYY